MVAVISGGGDLAKFMGMRLAKALLIIHRNVPNVDREVLCRWCVSAIQGALEGSADSGRLLLALVRSRSGRENIEQLLCCTRKENELMAILARSCQFANQSRGIFTHIAEGLPLHGLTLLDSSPSKEIQLFLKWCIVRFGLLELCLELVELGVEVPVAT